MSALSPVKLWFYEVISNTIKLPEAPLSKRGRQEASEIPRGGVSGRVIHQRSVAAIRSAYEATGGRLLIIGVGGTDSAEAAYEKIRAGASLLEVYTGLVYKGPGASGRLFEWIEMDEHGVEMNENGVEMNENE